MRQLPILFSSALLLCTYALAEAPAPIKIGWSGPLSGNSAVLGVDSIEAARMAVEEANQAGGIGGRSLELIVEDDQYDTSKALSAYNKLVKQDRVVAILMSTYGGVFATAQRAVADDVLVLNPLDCNNEIAALPKNTFCIATESESIGRIIAEDIHQRGLAPVGVFYDESNPFMVLVERALRERLTQLGKSSVLSHGVSQGTAEFKPLLLRLREKGIKSLVLFGHDPMGTAMSQARGLGLTAQFYTVGTITSPGYQNLAGDAIQGALVAFWQAPSSTAYKAFIERFRAKVGRPPILELATIPTYDATKILIRAVSTAVEPDGSISVDRMRQSLLAVKDYQGLCGQLTMDPDGAVRTIREAIYRFANGQLKPVR